jgi:ankyrin repeat protein
MKRVVTFFIITSLFYIIACKKTLKSIEEVRTEIYSKKANNELIIKSLKEGIDVNAKSDRGLTLLHDASLFDNYELAKFLIGYGADVNAKNNFNGTPLHYAESLKMTKLLVENGADVNAQTNTEYETKLHTCVNPEEAKYLLEHGADPHLRNSTENGANLTPFEQAVFYRRYETAKVILTYTKNVDPVWIEELNNGLKQQSYTQGNSGKNGSN